jgi:hypothetical protein
VTFIHGIGNKPAPEELIRGWRGTLADHGLDLDAEGVSASFVYWSDFLYPQPVVAEVDYESTGDLEDGSVPDVGMRWMLEAEGEEAKLVAGLAASIGYTELAVDEPLPSATPGEEAVGFERVPLPGWLKRRLMKIFLRDVHHYLFDAEFSPRRGETYKIREAIRKRALEVLVDGAAKPGPHVLVTHSMGTVIAYDCLKRVEGCPPVDGLMTIGSPLGLDDVQDGLRPEWRRTDGFPSERLRGRWVNVYDPLDPVAGLDPALANDYQRAEGPVVEDILERNWGKWRHSISKYFAGERLRAELGRLLDLSDAG